MITLFTIDCPKCIILEKKLNESNIKYEVCKDTGIMADLNITKLPVLYLNNTYLSYKEAIDWINAGGEISE